MNDFLRILNSLLDNVEETCYVVKVNGIELDMKFNSIDEIANHIAKLEIKQELKFEFYKDGEKVGEYEYEPKCDDDAYDCYCTDDADDEYEDDEEEELFSFEREFDNYKLTLTIERTHND